MGCGYCRDLGAFFTVRPTVGPPIAIALFSGSFCTDVERGFRLCYCRVFTKCGLAILLKQLRDLGNIFTR